MTSMDFRYSSQDFVSEIPKDAKFSRFDQELRGRWDEAVEKGFFRYKLGTLTTRVIEGPHGFVAQLNEKRATDRRKPQEITSTKQPYKPEEFNFNKVRPHERGKTVSQRITEKIRKVGKGGQTAGDMRFKTVL
nr:GDP-D-glucose phosphorylase 1-like [Lytechinus pictus]